MQHQLKFMKHFVNSYIKLNKIIIFHYLKDGGPPDLAFNAKMKKTFTGLLSHEYVFKKKKFE